MTTPVLGITELAPSQSEPEIPVNLSTRILEVIGGTASVESFALTAPPGSPSDGDLYVPAATATGAWAGKEDTLQLYTVNAWTTIQPKNGMLVRNKAGADWKWYSDEASPPDGWITFT